MAVAWMGRGVVGASESGVGEFKCVRMGCGGLCWCVYVWCGLGLLGGWVCGLAYGQFRLSVGAVSTEAGLRWAVGWGF